MRDMLILHYLENEECLEAAIQILNEDSEATLLVLGSAQYKTEVTNTLFRKLNFNTGVKLDYMESNHTFLEKMVLAQHYATSKGFTLVHVVSHQGNFKTAMSTLKMLLRGTNIKVTSSVKFLEWVLYDSPLLTWRELLRAFWYTKTNKLYLL